jgi:hypothetical protein
VSNTTSKASKSTPSTTTLADYVGAAEAFATLRGLAVAGGDATVEERAAAIVALAAEGGTVKANLSAEDEAHRAYLAARVTAQETRADLAIAIVLLSEEGLTNTAIAERFALPGGKTATATWLAFGKWVLASMTVKGDRAVRSGDATVRSAALSEGWNAILATKKAGGLNDKSFIAVVNAAGTPAALRQKAEQIKADKVAAKAPKEPVPGVDTHEPQTTGTTTVTAPEEPTVTDEPVVPGTTDEPAVTAPEEPVDDSLSLDADVLRTVKTVTAGLAQIKASILLSEQATREAVWAATAEWQALVDGISEEILAIAESVADEAASA